MQSASILVGFLLASLGSVLSLHVSGVKTGILGDYEVFICETGESESPQLDLTWKYKLKNGEEVKVEESDMLTPFDTKKNSKTRLIKLHSVDIDEIICESSSFGSASKKIQVQDLLTVTDEEDPCSKSRETEKPTNVVRSSSASLLSPYRNFHYISTDNSLKMTYPSDVSQIKLLCYSNSDAPKWTMKKGTASKMKFAAWAETAMDKPHCKIHVLEIFEVIGNPGDTVDFAFECKTDTSTSNPVNLRFEVDINPSTRIDYNMTETCVGEIVEQFYNKELTGVGIGSSFVIVLMMAGMAVMKKQLNDQKNVNQQLQNQSPNNNPDAVVISGVRSTDQLTPQSNDNTNT